MAEAYAAPADGAHDRGPSGNLFAGTASYYARFRPGYPAELVGTVARMAGLGSTSRVIDIGSGTGHLTVSLAPLVGTIIALEPSPDMNREATDAAARARVTNLTVVEGDSNDLERFEVAEFDCACFAAAFHWTDRDRTLLALDRVIAQGGAVVVVSGAAAAERPAWQDAVDKVRTDFLGPVRRAGSGTYDHPRDRHEVVLARSSFSEVFARTFSWTRSSTVDELVGRQLSFSYSARGLLGADLPRYLDALRAALAPFADNEVVAERLGSQVLVARRPESCVLTASTC